MVGWRVGGKRWRLGCGRGWGGRVGVDGVVGWGLVGGVGLRVGKGAWGSYLVQSIYTNHCRKCL